jgi:hypothetical protein
MIASQKLKDFKFPAVHVPVYNSLHEAHQKLSIKDIQLKRFHDYVFRSIEFFKNQNIFESHQNTLDNYYKKFKASFDTWEDLLNTYNSIPEYPGIVLDLLHLGIFDSSYAHDPHGYVSPFGPQLSILGDIMETERIDLYHAFTQQSSHPNIENLLKAQMLAIEMYKHFLIFVDENDIENLKMDKEDPSVLLLYAGGAVTWFSGFEIPTMIAIDQAGSNFLSGFSAVPHEFGHDLSGTFNEGALVASITENISARQLDHSEFWEMWVEEAFADTIGVATIGIGEVYSLANLFTHSYTNIIFRDESGERPDEHPNRHIRVLLTIEVAKQLGVADETALNKAQNKWIEFGKQMNTAIPNDQLYDQFNDKLIPTKEFEDSIPSIVEALVDTEYDQINNKRVRDIFDGFSNELADELTESIDNKRWTD